MTEGRPPRPLAEVQDVQVRDVKHSDNGRGAAVAGSAAASIIRGSSAAACGLRCHARGEYLPVGRRRAAAEERRVVAGDGIPRGSSRRSCDGRNAPCEPLLMRRGLLLLLDTKRST